MQASNYLENKIIDDILKKGTRYIALYTSSPTDSDSGTEVSGGGYARKQVTFGSATQQSDMAEISNASQIEFNKATANWGTVTHWAVRDASTAGNMLVWGSFTKSFSVEADNKIVIEPGSLKIQVG